MTVSTKNSQARESKPKHRKEFLPLAPAYVGFVLILVLPALLVSLFNAYVNMIVLTLLGLWTSFVLSFVWFHAASKRRGITLDYRNKLKHLPVGIGLGVLLQLALVLVGLLVILSFGFEPGAVGNTSFVVDASEFSSIGFLLFVVFSVAVLAPIFEELFFRGVVQPTVTNYYGPVIGIFLAAVAFGFMHIQPSVESSIYTIIMTTLGGVGFGVMRQMSSSLTLPIAAHIGFNSWAMLLLIASTLL